MIAAKIVVIILKAIYAFSAFLTALYCIEFAMQEKQERRYDNNGWLTISIFWMLLMIPICITTFSSNPYWSWDKVLMCFFPIMPLVMCGSDPHDIYEENYKKSPLKYCILLCCTIFVPWILGGCFEWQERAYNMSLIEKAEFGEAQIYSFKKCPDNNAAEHVHVTYYDANGYLKEMKIYPGRTVSDIEKIDPREWAKSGEAPVIITDNENKIAYTLQKKDGTIRGPKILYCTQYFYNEYIKYLSN